MTHFPFWRRTGMLIGVALFAAGLVLWLTLAGIDRQAAILFRLSAGGAFVPWTIGLTTIGSGVIMIPVGLAFALYLWRSQRRSAAIWLFVTVAFGRIMVELAKILIDRSRPPIVDHLVAVDSASFPSSHSAGSMMTALAIAAASASRWPGFAVALLFAVAVGCTRVMLGVHWSSDVLAGWGFGLFWVAAASRWRTGART